MSPWFRRKRRPRRADWARLVDALDTLGFYADHDAPTASRFKQEAVEEAFPFAGEGLARFHLLADAEDIAEGGVGRLLEGLRPFLRSRGVTFGETVDHFGPSGYDVELDGRRFPIWRESGELSRLVASQATAALLDTLLREAGAEDRACLLYPGGNEQSVVFLTAPMLDAIRRSRLLGPRDLPYRADDPVPDRFEA